MPIRRRGSSNAQAAPVSLPRRRFIQSSALAGAAVALGLPASAAHAVGSGQRVAIIGGGVAGLTAAHELAERGFQVSVYEQRAWGGKARSIPVPGTGTGGRLDLPGELATRFYAGFYNNLPDTMQRIPFANSAGNVWGNMVAPPQTLLAAGSRDFYANDATVISFPTSLGGLQPAIQGWLQDAFFGLTIPADELAFFASKLTVFLTSCDARRLQQWENMSWWDYTGAATRSANYQQLVIRFPSLLLAARGQEASARSIGQAVEAIIYTYARQGYRYPVLNVLNRPTNEAWIDAWCGYLAGLGVSLNLGVQATQCEYANGQVVGVQANAGGTPLTIQADWYVLAVPSEKVNALLPPAMQAADSQFAGIAQLVQRWFAGIQFFLTQPGQINNGPFACLRSPWSIGGLTEGQFWPLNFAATYGNGEVRDVLSVDVADWTTPGMLYGLPANQCTPQQIIQEVLAQMRNDLPHGANVLPDSVIQSWVIDPDLTGLGTANPVNPDPLFINTVGSWPLRPGTTTAIRNFFLAGDYVHALGLDLASMEAANESGRHAANAILSASGSSASPATIYTRYASPLLMPQFTLDAAQFAACLPNTFDVVDPYFPQCHA